MGKRVIIIQKKIVDGANSHHLHVVRVKLSNKMHCSSQVEKAKQNY